MKITAFESGLATGAKTSAQEKILPEEMTKGLTSPKPAHRIKTSREEAIEVAKQALSDVPDVREDVVAEIKARVESGEYVLDSSEIADMMIRRMKADRIR